jgi:hypothetical protein
MLSASSVFRPALTFAACALALAAAVTASAQTIDLSLNVFYTNPSNVNSGGTWELVAKSSNNGISGMRVFLSNVSSPQNEAPRGNVNGSDPAGFKQYVDTPHSATPPSTPAYHEFTLGQIPLDPPFPSGREEGAFYGVGTTQNASPGTVGPALTSLTNPQDIPWATGDAFGQSIWNTAARMLSGTFLAGVTPNFFTGDEAFDGTVFTSIGTSTSWGTETQVLASNITTTVRTNFVQSADYNHNGIVDAADYVLWRKTLGQSVAVGAGADGSRNGTIDLADFNYWRSHFGGPFGSGSSVGLSTSAVPEPATGALAAIVALLALGGRRERTKGQE